jgi:nicotinamidase-related amidase
MAASPNGPARKIGASSGLLELLTPDNCCVIFIDHQPAMTFGVANIDKQTLINNCVGLAEAAKTFNVPVILTAVESKSFSGNIWPQLTSLFPSHKVIERSSMNSWEDDALVQAVKATGRKKLVIAALWTEVCLTFPALCALADGYEVYAVEDCSGGTSQVAHDAAIARIQQAGGVRMTWIQTMLEWQRDWARRGTYDSVMKNVVEHGGVYGQAVEYCYTMVHKAPNYVERFKAGAAKH